MRVTAILVMVLALGVGFGDRVRAETSTRWGELISHTEDAGITWQGKFVQTEYIPCLFVQDAIWFEDGSAVC